MCGAKPDSSEHSFKASVLRRFYRGDWSKRRPEAWPFHFMDGSHSRLRGPNANRLKYSDNLCRRCNNDRSSHWDAAYDRLCDWLTSGAAKDAAVADLSVVLGPDVERQVRNLYKYFAKALGCRLADATATVPIDFPNPLDNSAFGSLLASICRLEPFRGLDNYSSRMGSRILGKGPLLANLVSRDTGPSEPVRKCVWWENIGCFQISYWFKIEPNPQFGDVLDGLRSTYRIVDSSSLNLKKTEKIMLAWLDSQRTRGPRGRSGL